MQTPRVLVLDDDPGITDVLCEILEEEGYEVLSAAGTVDPVDISHLRPRLIVLDLWFGGKAKGWDLLQEMRQTPGARHIPVIVCTADARMARETDRLQTLDADIMLKPFDLDDFIGRVAVSTGGNRSTTREEGCHGQRETSTSLAPRGQSARVPALPPLASSWIRQPTLEPATPLLPDRVWSTRTRSRGAARRKPRGAELFGAEQQTVE